eukprot:5294730-Pleurochrysis_carterae.AAC.1
MCGRVGAARACCQVLSCRGRRGRLRAAAHLRGEVMLATRRAMIARTAARGHARGYSLAQGSGRSVENEVTSEGNPPSRTREYALPKSETRPSERGLTPSTRRRLRRQRVRLVAGFRLCVRICTLSCMWAGGYVEEWYSQRKRRATSECRTHKSSLLLRN